MTIDTINGHNHYIISFKGYWRSTPIHQCDRQCYAISLKVAEDAAVSKALA